MSQFLNSKDATFGAQFQVLLGLKREASVDVSQTVSDILSDIQSRGDEALFELTKKFDHLSLNETTIAFTDTEIEAAISTIPSIERDALEQAADRIRDYHLRQKPTDEQWTGPFGETLGWRWTPVDRAGLYVPGGLASYPSSVLMNAIPAEVAGVKERIIAAPCPNGKFNPLVLLAAKLSGVSKIYKIGGAQAIGAMAYGTQTIDKVDVITGPGNAYVAAAKAQVYGQVGIDMIAGPSEILVIADTDNDPDWIALDLLSQAEHDESAQSILISTDESFGRAVSEAIDKRLQTLERRNIAGASWRENGAIIVVKDLDEAASLSDQIAPEHLELCVADPDALSAKITHAGAIFLGHYTPEAIGDYIGGPNHVLPTARSARFASGLSVLDFMKRTTLAKMTPEALAKIGPAGETLAKSEQLEAHGLSIRARLDRLNKT